MDEMTSPGPDDAAGGQGGASGTASAVAGAARSSAGNVASTAGDHVADVRDTVTQHAGEVASDAKAHATRLLRSSKEELRSQSDAQASRVAESLRSLSGELSSMAGATSEPSPLADITREAGQRLGSWADRLESRGVDGLRRDLAGMARRRPGTFLLGALASGFVAGRMLRTVQEVVGDDSSSDGAGSEVRSSAPGAVFPQPPAFPTATGSAAGVPAGAAVPATPGVATPGITEPVGRR
jgi:hypothetical protein